MPPKRRLVINKESTMQTIEFVVTGNQRMHCVGCETRITYVLRQLPGVRDVRASAKTQHVRVLLDRAGIDAQAVEDKLKELGYEAQQVESAA